MAPKRFPRKNKKLDDKFSTGDDVVACVPVSWLLNPTQREWPQPWVALTGTIAQPLSSKPTVYRVTIDGNEGFQDKPFNILLFADQLEKRKSKWGQAEYEIERIKASRPHKCQKTMTTTSWGCPKVCEAEKDYYIKWVGWTHPLDITWEPDLGVSAESVELFEKQQQLSAKYAADFKRLWARVQGENAGLSQDEMLHLCDLEWERHDCTKFDLCGPYCHEKWDLLMTYKGELAFRCIAQLAPLETDFLCRELGGGALPASSDEESHGDARAAAGGGGSIRAAAGGGPVIRDVPAASTAAPGSRPLTRSEICHVCSTQRLTEDSNLCYKCANAIHQRCGKDTKGGNFLCRTCVNSCCSRCYASRGALAQCLGCQEMYCATECSRVCAVPGLEAGVRCKDCERRANRRDDNEDEDAVPIYGGERPPRVLAPQGKLRLGTSQASTGRLAAETPHG